MRRGLGYGKGRGYFNLTLRDPMIHSLSARGIKSLQSPTVTLLSPRQYDKRFSKDYSVNEIGYATTKIKPQGKVDMFVRHTGDYERTGDLVAHELNELELWQGLVNKGIDPDKAEEMAHNMNPVKVEGVAETYEVSAKGQWFSMYGSKWSVVRKGKDTVLLKNKEGETLTITREEYEDYRPRDVKVRLRDYIYVQGKVIDKGTYDLEFGSLKYAKNYIKSLNPRAKKEAEIIL